MALDPQETLMLIDDTTTPLGEVSIDRIQGIRVFAKFQPGPEFEALKPLFNEFERAVNDQMFSLADELAERIGGLGLQLASAGGVDSIRLDDVQLMNGTDLCFQIPQLGLIQRTETMARTG